MDTLVSSRLGRATGGLLHWLHERGIVLQTRCGRHRPEWRCLRKILGKSRAAPLPLLRTAWATARGSWTDSPRDVGGRGDRAGKTGRTQIARPLGKEGRSPAAAARSLSRSSSRSGSWPTSGSDRGPSLSTRRSRLCGKLSPLCLRTSSAKYRPWNLQPDTSTSSARCCRATSWTPKCQAAVMWLTRGWATPSRCGGWRELGPCQHLTNIWRNSAHNGTPGLSATLHDPSKITLYEMFVVAVLWHEASKKRVL